MPFEFYQPVDHSKGRKAKVKERPKRELLPNEKICAIITLREQDDGRESENLLEASICNICRKQYFSKDCKHVETNIYEVNYDDDGE